MQQLTPFHLAFPVTDLAATAAFFEDVLGCKRGREADTWIDFDLFGHQLSLHKGRSMMAEGGTGAVDNTSVPMPHFGVVLAWDDWHALIDRLHNANVSFRIEPQMRFEGEPGEQGTFFVDAPGDVALEFKTFRDFECVFAS
ncbi:MAG: VOC family protein [Alphaproteobacteria bacterium]|nr:VOC family protein [Alphaproteobacteria bacterium]